MVDRGAAVVRRQVSDDQSKCNTFTWLWYQVILSHLIPKWIFNKMTSSLNFVTIIIITTTTEYINRIHQKSTKTRPTRMNNVDRVNLRLWFCAVDVPVLPQAVWPGLKYSPWDASLLGQDPMKLRCGHYLPFLTEEGIKICSQFFYSHQWNIKYGFEDFLRISLEDTVAVTYTVVVLYSSSAQ